MTAAYTDVDALLAGVARRFETSTSTIEPDPVAWAKQIFDVDLYSKQRTVLRLLEYVPKLAVPSCHDSGKSFLAALATARFLAKYPPGTARVVTTAPTGDQVRGVLWNEINALYGKKPDALPGRVNQTEWWIGNYMAGIGRKPSDYAPGSFQGYHAENILVILDEAGAMPNDLWTAIDTLTTNEGAKILAIGNPDDPDTEFKTVCDGAERPGGNGWTLVRIPAWETPNLSGERVTALLRKVLLAKTWVDDKRERWGDSDPRWASKVEAEFPTESRLTVVRYADVAYTLRGLDPDDDVRNAGGPRFEDVQLGVDVAASEMGDETVIRERRGRRLVRRWSTRSGEPEDVSDLIVQAQLESGATLVHVDATGVGFGFLSDVRRRVPDVAVLPFVAAAQARERVEFVNRRAEAYWTVRERLRKRQLDLSQLEDADTTVTQLLSARYTTPKGKILVEPKDKIRERLGRSPDDADALILAVEPPIGAGVPAPAVARAASARRQREVERRNRFEDGSSTNGTDDSGAKPRPIPERLVDNTRGTRRRRSRSIRAERY